MRIAIVVQARVGSTRLPNKVLLPLHGEPLLSRMLERLRLVRLADALVVATSVAPQDQAIVDLCDKLEIACVRGDEHDCLQRHIDAAHALGADVVAKIPSDCPLIDPTVVDVVLHAYRQRAGQVDYVSNLHPGSWPDGNDVEVMPLGCLEHAALETRDPFDREHTTPYLWRHPNRFRMHNVRWDGGLNLSKTHRWVVDWWEDYQLAEHCFRALYPVHGPHFRVDHILALYASRPELATLNRQHLHYDYRLSVPHADATP